MEKQNNFHTFNGGGYLGTYDKKPDREPEVNEEPLLPTTIDDWHEQDIQSTILQRKYSDEEIAAEIESLLLPGMPCTDCD